MTHVFEVFEKYGIIVADQPIGPVMQKLVHPEFVEQVLKNGK